jgi:hypothetical protein
MLTKPNLANAIDGTRLTCNMADPNRLETTYDPTRLLCGQDIESFDKKVLAVHHLPKRELEGDLVAD